MKKFIFLFMITLTALTVFAPRAEAQDKSYVLKPDLWYQETTFSTGDTISKFDTLYYVQYFTNKASPVKYNVTVDIDSVSGAPRVAASWQGKVFSDDSWTNITTVTWYGTSADTTIKFSETSTAKYYRYFRIYFDANTTAQKSRLSQAKVKFWDK